MEETMELKELFLIVKKRLVMIFVFGFLAMVGAGLVSFFVLTPIYEASTQLIVNTATEGVQITNQDIQTSVNLINTYGVIITSPAILDEVIEKLDLDMSSGGLQELITINTTNNSQVLSVSVRHEDSVLARDISNVTTAVFQERIGDFMGVENVSVLASANLPTSPVEPRLAVNMAIGLVVGLMLGVGLTFVLEYLDNKVKSEQEIEKVLGISVLGVVPLTIAGDFEEQPYVEV